MSHGRLSMAGKRDRESLIDSISSSRRITSERKGRHCTYSRALSTPFSSAKLATAAHPLRGMLRVAPATLNFSPQSQRLCERLFPFVSQLRVLGALCSKSPWPKRLIRQLLGYLSSPSLVKTNWVWSPLSSAIE